MKFGLLPTTVLIFGLILTGCDPAPETVEELGVNDTTFAPVEVQRAAVAELEPTEGSDVRGTVTFTEENDGIRIVASVTGLSPGAHGFHVHEFGDCSAADASSAGAHFDPTDGEHAGPDHDMRHVGDLGNIVVDEDGTASYDRLDTVISFEGTNSILDKAVIVHESEDDLVTQPTGDAGGRLACGVIELALGSTDVGAPMDTLP